MCTLTVHKTLPLMHCCEAKPLELVFKSNFGNIYFESKKLQFFFANFIWLNVSVFSCRKAFVNPLIPRPSKPRKNSPRLLRVSWKKNINVLDFFIWHIIIYFAIFTHQIPFSEFFTHFEKYFILHKTKKVLIWTWTSY